tara:strand:+ start:5615 stop:7012 length:1398 start_codon:yes stop_codon:yes gene_type:complete
VLKKLLISIWITGWSIIAAYEISTTLELINASSNKETWPPQGFVIVENRGGDKVMITEETDQKYNPKNSEICNPNFISVVNSSIEDNILHLSYTDEPNFFGVDEIKLKIIPSGDRFSPDKGFKIHNFKTIELTNNLNHEIPLNIYEVVNGKKYYIDFVLEGFGKNKDTLELCFSKLLLSINENNFKSYMENSPFYLGGVLEPAFEENPNILNIGEDEYIDNIIENNKKKLLNDILPPVDEAAIVLLNRSTRYSEMDDKNIWIYYPTYIPDIKNEIVVGLFGDVISYDFITLSNVLEVLKIVAPKLKITISDDKNDVTLPIHLSPCNKLLSEKFNNCEGYAAGIYNGFHDYIWVDSSITNKDWRSHVIIHELGHALGLNHNLCIDSVMSYSEFSDDTTYFNYLDLMQLRLLYHPDAGSYGGKGFENWSIDYFDLDEDLIKRYKNDPYLACNGVDKNGWIEFVEMQK